MGECISRLIKEKEELTNVLLSLASDLKRDGKYLSSAKIYYNIDNFLIALKIVNLQFSILFQKISKSLDEFRQYVDIGETILLCMDVPILSYSVESMPNKKILSENEYEFVTEFICFCLLQSYYDIILQKRKDKSRQV